MAILWKSVIVNRSVTMALLSARRTSSLFIILVPVTLDLVAAPASRAYDERAVSVCGDVCVCMCVLASVTE